MKLLELFYDKKPADMADYYDEKLGTLIWVSENNEWQGTYNGITIRLDYEINRTTPTRKMLDSAFSILSDQRFLESQLLKGKKYFSGFTLHLIWKIDHTRNTGRYQCVRNSIEKLVYEDIFIQRQGRNHYFVSCKLRSLIDGRRYQLEFLDKGFITFDFQSKREFWEENSPPC